MFPTRGPSYFHTEEELSRRNGRIVRALVCVPAALALMWPLAAHASESAAFQSVGGDSLTVNSPVSIVAGAAGVSIGTVSIKLVDGAAVPGDGWTAGDTLSVELTSDPAGKTAICDATLAKPTVTAVDGDSDPYAGITVATGTTPTCGSQANAEVLTLPAAPADSASTVISLSGMTLTPGQTVTNGAAIYLAVSASAGTPFGTGAPSQVQWVATLATATTTVTKIGGFPASTLAAPVGDINVTDVTGGTVAYSLVFSLTGSDTFASVGTLTGPTGVTISAAHETPPSSTLTFGVVGTSPAGGTYDLSGTTINLGSTPGLHKVSVSTVAAGANTGTLLGGATPFAVTAKSARIAGTDRYGTAGSLFTGQFSNATRPHGVVLASGVDFPDALSADFLASKLGTGLLLTDPSTLSPQVALELATDDVDNVYIVGGTASVSANVAAQVAAIHVLGDASKPVITVNRFAGADRFATNNLVDEAALSLLGNGSTATPTFPTAILATGNEFADALSAGPVVYAEGMPLVLTDSASLSPSALQSLKDLGTKNVIIVGGDLAISAATETALTAAGFPVEYRIAGEDRTATAALVGQWASVGLPQTPVYKALASLPGWSTTSIYLGRGDNFADSLAAGAVAGANGESILLTADPVTLGSGIPSFLSGRAGVVTSISVLGGSSALTPKVVDAAISALTSPTVAPSSTAS
jgi:putative cell wall-binding protein